MLPLSITRNRKVEREQKVHDIAVRRALERKAVREFVKANPEVLTDEEELQDSGPEQKSEQLNHSKLNERIKSAKDQNSDHFFDVCNEKISELSIKDKKNKKSKKSKKQADKPIKKAGGASKKIKKAKKSPKEKETTPTVEAQPKE